MTNSQTNEHTNSRESQAASLPVTTYTPETGLRHPKHILVGLWRDIFSHQARDLAWRMFLRSLASQYRQTLLGYFWLFFPPLVNAGIFIFLNSQKILEVQETIVPYAVFTLVGNLLWQSMLQCLKSPLSAIQAEKSMLTKLNFSREALLSAGLMKGMFSGIIPLLIIPVILLIARVEPSTWMFMAPVGVLAFMLLGFSIGVFLTPIGLLYKDIGQAIPLVARFWMFLSPVVYAVPKEGLGRKLLLLNPATPLLENARNWMVGLPAEFPGVFVAYIVACLVLLFMGLVIFRLAMPIIVERMSA
jgi:lipopolysaccharide transport system permease protein